VARSHTRPTRHTRQGSDPEGAPLDTTSHNGSGRSASCVQPDLASDTSGDLAEPGPSDRARRSRAAQGLGPTVQDAELLRRVARLVRITASPCRGDR
jgi:hypothetical protein